MVSCQPSSDLAWPGLAGLASPVALTKTMRSGDWYLQPKDFPLVVHQLGCEEAFVRQHRLSTPISYRLFLVAWKKPGGGVTERNGQKTAREKNSVSVVSLH